MLFNLTIPFRQARSGVLGDITNARAGYPSSEKRKIETETKIKTIDQAVKVNEEGVAKLAYADWKSLKRHDIMGGGEGNTENGIPAFSFDTNNGEINNDPPAGFRLAQASSNNPCDYYVRNGNDEAFLNACLKKQFSIHHVIYFAVPFHVLYATITAMFCTGQFFL